MEKIREFIDPDVYNKKQMRDKGWSDIMIDKYCEYRSIKWKKLTKIFIKMFTPFIYYVDKKYDCDEGIMVVYGYDKFGRIVCESKHEDPIFALAECAKQLQNEDQFIHLLLQDLTM